MSAEEEFFKSPFEARVEFKISASMFLFNTRVLTAPPTPAPPVPAATCPVPWPKSVLEEAFTSAFANSDPEIFCKSLTFAFTSLFITIVSTVPATETDPTEPEIVAPVNSSDCVAFTRRLPNVSL